MLSILTDDDWFRLFDAVAASRLGGATVWVAAHALRLGQSGSPFLLNGSDLASRIGVSHTTVNAAVRALTSVGFLARDGRSFTINGDYRPAHAQARIPSAETKDWVSILKPSPSELQDIPSGNGLSPDLKICLSELKPCPSKTKDSETNAPLKGIPSTLKGIPSDLRGMVSIEASLACARATSSSEEEINKRGEEDRKNREPSSERATSRTDSEPPGDSVVRDIAAGLGYSEADADLPGDFVDFCRRVDRLMPAGRALTGARLKEAWRGGNGLQFQEMWGTFPEAVWVEALYRLADHEFDPARCHVRYFLSCVRGRMTDAEIERFNREKDRARGNRPADEPEYHSPPGEYHVCALDSDFHPNNRKGRHVG